MKRHRLNDQSGNTLMRIQQFYSDSIETGNATREISNSLKLTCEKVKDGYNLKLIKSNGALLHVDLAQNDDVLMSKLKAMDTAVF